MGQQRYKTADPAAGQVWEERDRLYSDGRQIRIETASGRRVYATCIKYDKRPHLVGRRVQLHEGTLRQKWFLAQEAP